MKISYEFADGEIQVVEVDEKIGKFIQDSRREEENGNDREDYHRAFSLDEDRKRTNRISGGGDPCEELITEAEKDLIQKGMKKWTPVQRRRMEQLKNGKTIREIARDEGSYLNAVQSSITLARKKIKNIFYG